MPGNSLFSLKEACAYFSGVFRGQPLGLTFRIASSAEGSYTGDLVLGFIFATIRRCRTVVGFIFKSSANSATVYPSILYISVIIARLLRKVKAKTRRMICENRTVMRKLCAMLCATMTKFINFGLIMKIIIKNEEKTVKKLKNIGFFSLRHLIYSNRCVSI